MKFGPQILALLCVIARNVVNTHADDFTAATSSESPEYHIHSVFLGADGQIALEIQPEERPNSKSINLLSDQKLMFCDE